MLETWSIGEVVAVDLKERYVGRIEVIYNFDA